MVAKRRGDVRHLAQDPYRALEPETAFGEEIRAHLMTKFSMDDPEFLGTLMEFGRIGLSYGIDLTPEKAEEVIRRIIDTNRKRDANKKKWEPRTPGHDPIVYYMRLGNRIKIGTSTHLYSRNEAIRAEEIMIVEKGSYDVEKMRHRQFAELRTVGEWFRYEEPLVSHIAWLQAATRAASE